MILVNTKRENATSGKTVLVFTNPKS